MSIPTKQDSDPTRLIVCEKRGQWASLLCRTLPDGGRWILETRGLRQLLEAAKLHPASLVLCEVNPRNLMAVTEEFSQLRRNHPRCHLIAAAGEEYDVDKRSALPSEVEWVLREIGVVHWIRSQRDAAEASRVWSFHCRMYPPVERAPREQLLRGLPWPDA